MFVDSLPGWELVMFIVLFLAFIITGAVITFYILSRLRWPFTYVVLEDTAGKGFGIAKRGRARLVTIGDEGEEIFLLKHINKYRIGNGKRIGPKQLGWAVGNDGYWYQFEFGDLNKKLLELGVMPVSRSMRLSMSAVRKNLEKRLGDKSWMEQYGLLLYSGMFIMTLLIFAGIVWYSTNKQVEIAQINSASANASLAVQMATQKTLDKLDNVLSRISSNPAAPTSQIIGGSGLIADG